MPARHSRECGATSAGKRQAHLIQWLCDIGRYLTTLQYGTTLRAAFSEGQVSFKRAQSSWLLSTP